jgi:hypothetical protein
MAQSKYKHGHYRVDNNLRTYFYWCAECGTWIIGAAIGFPTHRHWFSVNGVFICNIGKSLKANTKIQPQGETNMTSPDTNIYGSVHGERNFLTGSIWCARCHKWTTLADRNIEAAKHWTTGTIEEPIFVCGMVPAYSAEVQSLEFKEPAAPAPATEVNEILTGRGKNYSAFIDNAALSQDLKAVFAGSKNWLGGNLAADQKESLQLIALKISRILTGDPNYVDNWDDIAGYATLVSKRIQGETL